MPHAPHTENHGIGEEEANKEDDGDEQQQQQEGEEVVAAEERVEGEQVHDAGEDNVDNRHRSSSVSTAREQKQEEGQRSSHKSSRSMSSSTNTSSSISTMTPPVHGSSIGGQDKDSTSEGRTKETTGDNSQ